METSNALRAKAKMCRRLARGADQRTRDNLLVLAVSYETEADKHEPA